MGDSTLGMALHGFHPSVFIPIEHHPAVQKFLEWIQLEYFLLYRARPIDAPILHMLCTDEKCLIESRPRFGCRKAARHGIKQRFFGL